MKVLQWQAMKLHDEKEMVPGHRGILKDTEDIDN